MIQKTLYRSAFVCAVAALVLLVPLSSVSADGGAPNLAYVAGTTQGISVIDIGQRKVAGTLAIQGDPQTILLSIDGRLLSVTQPTLGRVSVIATASRETICTLDFPGHPSLLALDPGTNTLYTAGNDSREVVALDPQSCVRRFSMTTDGPVGGIAVALVGNGLAGGNQLWITNSQAIQVFDARGKHLAAIPLADGPLALCIPAGATAYVTTRRGTVEAIDLQSRRVYPLDVMGGSFGPMDYNAITGDIYIPDAAQRTLIVLSPFVAGSATKPRSIYHLSAAPESIAITSDGQLGFVALADGSVVMLDLLAHQEVTTFQVGGRPHFIITGLYPSRLTPQQASLVDVAENIAHYGGVVVVILTVLVAIILNRRNRHLHGSASQKSK